MYIYYQKQKNEFELYIIFSFEEYTEKQKREQNAKI